MATPKRGLLVVPNHSVVRSGSGVLLEAAEVQLLNEIKEKLGRVAIAAFVEDEENTSLGGYIGGNEMEVYALNVRRHSRATVGKAVNYVSAGLRLPNILRQYGMAYIFAPGRTALLAALWSRWAGRPYGVYVRGTWLDGRGNARRLWQWVFRGASFVIVTGEAFRRRLVPINSNVVNEVPLTALRSAQGVEADIERRGRAVRRLMFAGRLTESKGVLDVVQAVGVLRARGFVDVDLRIAGGGEPGEVERLAGVIRGLGLEGRVTLVGQLDADALAELYRTADVFVFPSYYPEGLPRVLYEAMMYGLPIVATAMPGTEGLLVDGANYVECAPRSPESVAEGIERLLLEPQVAARLGREARAAVEAVFAGFREKTHGQQLVQLVRGVGAG